MNKIYNVYATAIDPAMFPGWPRTMKCVFRGSTEKEVIAKMRARLLEPNKWMFKATLSKSKRAAKLINKANA